MADQNVTAGIRGVQALADKENELRRVKETLAREQREKSAAEEKLAAANSQIQTMKAAQAQAAQARSQAAQAAGGVPFVQQAGALPEVKRLVPVVGQAGAASKWDPTGAPMRSEQARQAAEELRKKEIADSQKSGIDGNDKAGQAAIGLARGLAGATIGVSSLASAASMAKAALEDMAKTRQDKFKGAAEKNLAVAEAARSEGMNAEQEDRLRETVFNQRGRLTVSDKARLASISSGTNTGKLGLVNRQRPGSTIDVIAAADANRISLAQAEKVLSGEDSMAFDVGLAYQLSIGPQQELSDVGKEAMSDAQMETRVEDSFQFPARSRLTKKQMLEQFRTNEAQRRKLSVKGKKQAGKTASAWWEDATGWLSDAFTGDEDIIAGGGSRTWMPGDTSVRREELGSLSNATLLKAQLTIQQQQLQEAQDARIRAATSVPSNREGKQVP